jgi:hypothetical protein
MEAISTFRNAGISRKTAVIVAMLGAFAIGGGSGYWVKTVSLPTAQAMQHTVQQTVYEQVPAAHSSLPCDPFCATTLP